MTPRCTGCILVAVLVPTLALTGVLSAQEPVAPYCSDLNRVADLAMTHERSPRSPQSPGREISPIRTFC
jgi:hypothetical protein